jgi:hypothetical protein
MRTFGIITASLAGVAAVVGVALGIRSVPDLRRYLRIRSM